MYKLVNVTNLRNLYKIINYSQVKNNKELLDWNKKLLISYQENNTKDWSIILNKLIIEPKKYKKIDIKFDDIERKNADLSLIYYPPNYASPIKSYLSQSNISMVLDGAFIYQEYNNGLSCNVIKSKYIKKGTINMYSNEYRFHNYKSDISCSGVILSIDYNKINLL